MNIKEIFEQARQVALYQDPKFGSVHIGQFFGEKDAHYHGGDVRISLVLDVRFEQMPTDELVRTAVAAFDAAEIKVRLELQKQINEIREHKQQFLALTHSPDVA